MSFPRYEHYKDSGVEWLGEVPAGWDVVPIKCIANVVNGYPFDSKLFESSEGYPLVRIRDLNSATTETRYNGDFVEQAAITSEDVLVGMDGDFNVGRWRGEGRALLNQRMCCVRGQSEIITRLLEYALPIPLKAINEVTYSTTVKHLSSFQVEKTRVALPPLLEQHAIASFLDRETAKIDTLIAEQQRLIALLAEKRQAVISHAVTKGLDQDAPMKDTRIEWLGDVPAGWEETRLANLFKEVDERGNEGLPVLCVSIHSGISDRELDEDEMDRKVSRSEDRSIYKQVMAGDLVYNMMRAWQGAFGAAKVNGMVSPAYVVARPRRPLITTYIELLLRTPQAIEQMRRHSKGVTDFRLRLYWDEFKDIRVAVPPYEEAKNICAHVEEMVSGYENLSLASQQVIDLLQERRTALISAAVTGKIDVRSF